MGDRDLEREKERRRILSGEMDGPDLPYLSGDLPLNLEPLGGGDLKETKITYDKSAIR